MSITVEAFEGMVEELKRESEAHARLKKLTSEQNSKVEECKLKVMTALDEMGKTSYKSDVGMVSKKVRWSWKVPKEEGARNAYRKFLEDSGDFDGMWSIHSASMNAHCKALLEDAKERGDIDFSIPGLDEPSAHETISLTKR